MEQLSPPIEVITDHPLPLTQEQADRFQTDNPFFDGSPELSVDELHEECLKVKEKADPWQVFEVELRGFENTVYLWNQQHGYGIRIPNDERQFDDLCNVLAKLIGEPAHSEDQLALANTSRTMSQRPLDDSYYYSSGNVKDHDDRYAQRARDHIVAGNFDAARKEAMKVQHCQRSTDLLETIKEEKTVSDHD